MFDFRKKGMETFNEVRRIMASGRFNTMIVLINKAIDVVNDIKGGEKLRKLPTIGPASNMYKLKWSTQMEQEAWLYMKNQPVFTNESAILSFEYKEYVGFKWLGAIVDVVKKFIQLIPHERVREVLETAMEAIHVLMIAVMIAWNYPMSLPVSDNTNLGPTESLFAHRYEIGCASGMMFTTCFMEKSRNGGYLYDSGLPCSKCPTHCEFVAHEDGMMEEGDLCIPPREDKPAEAKAQISLIPNRTVLPVFLLVALFIVRTEWT
uniref:Uncharacterized protein n=1 Tax=Caenorhabditis japonica TaxID=281687 RepID=A0A8R1HGU1_CAEJA